MSAELRNHLAELSRRWARVARDRFGEQPPAALLFPAFLIAALILRAPTFAYAELGWDEQLYRMIAERWLDGALPYTELWDRKPIGVFAIFGTFQAVFGDGILAARIASATAVAATASMLVLIARQLFARGVAIGLAAGLIYIAYTLRSNGDEANTEILFAPFMAAALYFVVRSAGQQTSRAANIFAASAGLAAGFAFQLKYVVVFEAAFFAAVYLVLAAPWLRRQPIVRSAQPVLFAALGFAAPTAAVFLIYWLSGSFAELWRATIVAHFGILSGDQSAYPLRIPFAKMQEFSPLWMLCAAGLGSLAWRARADKQARCAALVVGLWLLGCVASLIYMRRFADHMFHEILPVLALGAAVAIVMFADSLRRRLGGAAAAAAGLIITGLLVGWGVQYEWRETIEVLQMRTATQNPAWGDRTADAARILRGRVPENEHIFVFARTLGVYELLDVDPPTRFPFHLHLTDTYAPIDGPAEIERILEARPAFILVGDEKGPARSGAYGPEVYARLEAALADGYAEEIHLGRYRSAGGGHLGEGVGLTIYRRKDIAPAP